MYEKELSTALKAVQQAAKLTASVQFNLLADDSIEKNDRSPVTIADYGSQAVISSILAADFPQDPLVGEEDTSELKQNQQLSQRVLQLVQENCATLDNDAMLEAIERGNAEPDYRKRYWTLDPIDGTKGFLRKDQYAIALALVQDGELKLGVLGCPNLPLRLDEPDGPKGSLLYAVKGQGAFMAAIDEPENAQPIQAQHNIDIADAKLVESVEAAHSAHSVHQKFLDDLGITQPGVRIDSQCKYAVVARGEASIYLRIPKNDVYREKIWDHAAGAMIVEEAGGQVSDMFGNPLAFDAGKKMQAGCGVIATNGKFHSQVIRTITKIREENHG